MGQKVAKAGNHALKCREFVLKIYLKMEIIF